MPWSSKQVHPRCGVGRKSRRLDLLNPPRGNAGNAHAQVGQVEDFYIGIDHRDAGQMLEKREDTDALRRARGLVVARDNNQRRAPTPLLKLTQSLIGVQQAGVGRAHGVEQVARNHHEVGFGAERLLERVAERLHHIRLALVLPELVDLAIGAIAQMNITQVCDLAWLDWLR